MMYFTHTLMGSNLEMTDQEKDLEKVVNNLMQMSSLCLAAVKKANSMLRMIRKEIEIQHLVS